MAQGSLSQPRDLYEEGTEGNADVSQYGEAPDHDVFVILAAHDADVGSKHEHQHINLMITLVAVLFSSLDRHIPP
jgi:hypothetical protein